MFLQSVFSRNKSGACDGALALDATPFVDTEDLVLSVSKELISDVESYFWNQVGMFGGTVFRSLPVEVEGRIYVADSVVSLVHNLYVITCRDFLGEVKRPEDVHQRWSLTDGKGKVAFCESPVRYNAECVRGICNLLKMSPKRVISVIMFTDRTVFADPAIRTSRLRVEHLSDLCSKGIWDVDGTPLETPELSKIDAVLSEVMYGNRPIVQLPTTQYAGSSDKEGLVVCPRCGHPLKLTTTNYGIFVNCTMYPVCTFIHRVQE